MSREEKRESAQGPIVIATAAITVAVVVTLGALTGYLRPPTAEPAAQAATEAPPPDAQSVAPTPPALSTEPRVVLVPIRPEAPPPEALLPEALPADEWPVDEPLVRTAVWRDDDRDEEADEHEGRAWGHHHDDDDHEDDDD